VFKIWKGAPYRRPTGHEWMCLERRRCSFIVGPFFLSKSRNRARGALKTHLYTRSREEMEEQQHDTHTHTEHTRTDAAYTTRCRRRRQSGRQLSRASDLSAVYIRELEIATDVNSGVAGWSVFVQARDVSRLSPIGCPRDLICKRKNSTVSTPPLFSLALLCIACSQCQMPNKRLVCVFFFREPRESVTHKTPADTLNIFFPSMQTHRLAFLFFFNTHLSDLGFSSGACYRSLFFF